MPVVTSPRRTRRYVRFIEYGIERGDTHMSTTISHKIANLALALATFLPVAMAVLHQGAQIVA